MSAFKEYQYFILSPNYARLTEYQYFILPNYAMKKSAEGRSHSNSNIQHF